MQEIINCPSCQRKLQVPESLLGQDVQCPTCGATFIASWGNQAPSPPPQPVEPPPFHEPPERGPIVPPPYQRPKDDYDDYREYDDRDRPRRYRHRRDLMPHRGSTVLTLGILSLVLFFFTGIGGILGPIAWIMGHQDMNEIKAGRMDPEGESATNSGRICGIIATILMIISTLSCCLFFGLISTRVIR